MQIKSKVPVKEFFKHREPDFIVLNRKEREYMTAGIYTCTKISDEIDFNIENNNPLEFSYSDLAEHKAGKEILEQREITKAVGLWTMAEIQSLMEVQMELNDERVPQGFLQTDGHWNVFFVKSLRNEICMFFCIWSCKKYTWGVGTERIGDLLSKGSRVFLKK